MSTPFSFDSQHEDMIHDAQLDYFGKRLATCSSDRTIKIFSVVGNTHKLLATLKGHDGPVWQVSWGHPKFGSILASCSFDHKVFIWKETSANVWTKIKEYKHESSVNAIAWAPYELGLQLASASSDSTIAIISYRESNNTWETSVIKEAHNIGCNSVSWAPATPIGGLTSGSDKPIQLVRRIVSGGGDNKVKIWRCTEDGVWQQEPEYILDGHTDWVRDVSWAPNIGLPYDTIASCSQDRNVIIWTKEQNSEWKKTSLPKFNAVVWRVSWSITGNILAVSCADNKVTLWKETLDGKWQLLQTMASSEQHAK
jgi:protein transport protein SEC13